MKIPAIPSLRAVTVGLRGKTRELPRALAELRRVTNYPRRAARGIRGGAGGFPRIAPGFPRPSISFLRGTNRLRQQIVDTGAPAPSDPESMPFLATDTKPPYHADFDASEVGKTAYYALRWTNTVGETGPWSEISGYLIN